MPDPYGRIIVLQEKLDEYHTAVTLTRERLKAREEYIEELENYLRQLRDVTPHTWLKDEINETLGTSDGDQPNPEGVASVGARQKGGLPW